jgi:lauroyl/myristoyl acyltransferase
MNEYSHRTRGSLVGHDSYWLRKLAYAGARYGSTHFVRTGPVAIGAIFSGILPKYRRIVRANLRRIYGQRGVWQENRDVTKTFVDYACCLTESLGFERMNPKDIVYNLVGRPSLDSVLSQTAGFIVATAHVGAWDSAAMHLRQMTGRPVLVVMTRESDPAARTFHDSIRTRQGVEVAHVGQNAFEGLKLLKHLRRGGIIAVQLDRLPESSRALEILLFKQRFEVPRGPFQLASLASVPIIPVFCARIGHFEYEIHVNLPIVIDRRANVDRLTAAAQEAMAALEEFLRKYPTQWFHFGNIDSALSVI